MAPVVFRDKVQVLDRRRVYRRLDGLQARVRDGPRRQPPLHVSVEGGFLRQMGPLETAVEVGDAVDDSRIALQRQALLQAIMKYGGDQRALVVPSCFLLDDGRQSQYLAFSHLERRRPRL